jgi:hypothetical protein
MAQSSGKENKKKTVKQCWQNKDIRYPLGVVVSVIYALSFLFFCFRVESPSSVTTILAPIHHE